MAQPDRAREESPAALGLCDEPLALRSAGGTRLTRWLLPTADRQNPKDARGTVVHRHGNAPLPLLMDFFNAALPPR